MGSGLSASGAVTFPGKFTLMIEDRTGTVFNATE